MTHALNTFVIFCFNAHKRLKKFMDHNVKDLADLDEVFKEDIALRKPSALYLCLQHPSEIIQLYCLECDAVVCNKCIVSSEHRGHEFTEIDSQARKEVDDKLISLSTTIDEELKLQIDHLNYVKKVEKVTSDMASELQEKINYTFDSYAAGLEARRTELLAESESKCSAKMKILWSERDSLERTIADMTTTQNFAKQARQCKNNTEFLQLTSQVLPRLRKLENWEWSDERVDEVERYSLDFEESDVTVDLISNACSLEEDQLPHYTVEFSEFKTKANLGKEHSFTIHVTPGKCCQPWTYIETPIVELKHVRSKTCDVADISITSTDHDNLDFIRLLQPESFESMNDKEKWELTNIWIVTYTPYCGGSHTLMINIGDESTKRIITVHGTPPIGSQVMMGPDSYGNVDGKVVKYNAYSMTVSVKRILYGATFGTTQFSWGRSGQYDIQLKH